MSEQNPARMAFGLHIAKCAGTSLMTTVRRNMGESNYHLCSSYFNNLVEGRPLLQDILRPEMLRFVFGHFGNETLLAAFVRRSPMLFTGLRSPIERAKSNLAQANFVRNKGRFPPITADQYLHDYSTLMCDHIIRSFPSIGAKLGNQSKFEKAKTILSLFDYIYDSDQFDRQARPILEWLHIPQASIVTDNVTSKKDFDAEMLAFHAEQCEQIDRKAKDLIEDDIRLYEFFAPHFGVMHWSLRYRPASWCIYRKPYFESLGDPEIARAAHGRLEILELVREARQLGQLEFLRSVQINRIASAQRALAAMDAPSS